MLKIKNCTPEIKKKNITDCEVKITTYIFERIKNFYSANIEYFSLSLEALFINELIYKLQNMKTNVTHRDAYQNAVFDVFKKNSICI